MMEYGSVFKSDMLEPDYKTEFSAWKQNPSPQTMTPLVNKIRPEIERGISAHVGQSNPVLYGRAKKMAIGALRTYDPTKAKLGTHIVNQLQGLRRVNRQQANVISIPERMQLNLNFVSRAQSELEDQLGREPTLDELADHTGLSRNRIRSVRKLRMPLAEGQVAEGGDADSEGGYSPAVKQKGTEDDMWLWVVYDDQDNVNKKIMEWTLGLHGGKALSNAEIAQRLRLTPGAVSQRKARIQELLDQRSLLEL
jgi:DNA-directed RNA polymerase specialized sigma subunit